ncbi:MAG: endonuclease III [Candidatus Thermoplasmatota archaeon]|jgi:endonuclease-3|nr:endonuclease III [Candidatus Thermoplasmatota archaeon]MCL5794694.1 endonuclease III [Candidatus Thermoplasmatota archaeon]
MNLAKGRSTFDAVYSEIRKLSPDHHFEFRDPFWVLITTILSHRTKDEVTDAAARNLYKRYGTCESLAGADYSEVSGLISKVGFYTRKAERVIEVSRILRDRYNCRVPETIEKLMEFPGVGRKTANVVLADAMGIPAIAVDTHVQRVSRRIGWSLSDDPEATEERLRKIVPRDMWLGFNPVLVEFGKHVCKPITPNCTVCGVRPYCDFYREERSKAHAGKRRADSRSRS